MPNAYDRDRDQATRRRIAEHAKCMRQRADKIQEEEHRQSVQLRKEEHDARP